ncbi:CDP-glycerol glycerophosphotransferase family protein [Staphylococcus nepalensis]|uniref:CDP-glycerol glycerophosphotransferase family protein n=2 Tax=Staphylococcus nepalensis TaxID=214473 RepID=UPI000DFADCAE|nr:CDP-glycerol glycerophosphotransferase family protein [Staphylococcus nepalensis]SUM71126.1 galactosamine-containing minor teichoic acid biosynthesis protein [Staphylococcus nepalensis]SUM96637.1 galactosamine-containing minor teichoic acid biosynthesis protein [Staphylococcus nepalensis]
MDLKLVNYNIGYIEYQSNQIITLGFHNSKKLVKIDQTILQNDEIFLFSVNRSDALLGIINYHNVEYFLHVKNNYLICTKYINGETKGSLELKFTIYDDRFQIEKDKYNYIIIDKLEGTIFKLDGRLFEVSHNMIINKPNRLKGEKVVYMKIRYANYYNFVEYTKKKDRISLKSFDYSDFQNNKLKISFSRANILNIKTKNSVQKVKISELKLRQHLRLDNSLEKDLTFPTFLRVGKRIFVIIKNSENGNIYIKFNTRINLMLKYSEFNVQNKYNHFLLKGNIEYKENPLPDSIMTNKGKILSELKWTNETHFIAKIKKRDIFKLPNIHTSLYLSKNNEVLHPLKRYNIEKKPSKKIVYTTSTFKKKVLVARLNLANNISLSVVPHSPFYNLYNQFKLNMAYKISKSLFPKKLNLYFEKEASKIGESGSYIFEEIMKDPSVGKHNYYILDKKSKDYSYMKKKWGRNVVKRFSFKHYLYILLSTSFISSELSSHVISGRLFSDKLNVKIRSTPLYFLQHGIMFAKPVDNPMAAGFHKKNMLNNVVKNVISSDLEANEFYKMGYNEDDLMKTGLSKFDGAYLNDDANKITFMPTWRYWEEAEILNGNLKNTTYFESFISVIQAFEKANLLHKLQITAHNKFSEFITESLPQYESIICDDPTEALKNSRIFITDYSSIIYDSIYRGAYPIFYWKDKDYLIKNYQATPPVNDQNAPGKIAYSESQLIDIVKEAIAKNYTIEKDNLEKYRKINEFFDGKNSQRIIQVLKKENVL